MNERGPDCLSQEAGPIEHAAILQNGRGHAMRRSCLRYGSGMMVWIVLSWGCAAVPPCSAPESLTAPASSIHPINSVLQQKVKAQEKRISELSAQLQLLKRIDHDQQRQR